MTLVMGAEEEEAVVALLTVALGRTGRAGRQAVSDMTDMVRRQLTAARCATAVVWVCRDNRIIQRKKLISSSQGSGFRVICIYLPEKIKKISFPSANQVRDRMKTYNACSHDDDGRKHVLRNVICFWFFLSASFQSSPPSFILSPFARTDTDSTSSHAPCSLTTKAKTHPRRVRLFVLSVSRSSL